MKSQLLLCICLLLFGIATTSCNSDNQVISNETSVTPSPAQTPILPTDTPMPTPNPTPESTPTLPPPVENFTFTDYGLAQYGLTLSHPESWALSDIGDALVLTDQSSPLAVIFFETGSATNFGDTNPVAILNKYYPSIALGMLKGEGKILELPSALDINGQKAGIMSLETVPTVGTDAPLVNAFAGIIINEERFVLVQGVTLPEEVDKFAPVFQEVFNSIELSTPAGVPIISPETVHQHTKVDLARPNFYRLAATDNNPVTIIAKPEEGILAPLLLRVYNSDENLYLQELMPDQKDILAETKGANMGDLAALAFWPEQGKDYLIGVGTILPSQGDFSVYMMDGVPDSQLLETGNLVAGEPSELEFTANADEEYLVTVKPVSDIDIRFEIQDGEGKRLDVVDYGVEGETESYVFAPKADDKYILKIRSMNSDGETEYMASIGEIGSVFSE